MVEFSYENISDAVFHHAAQTPEAPAMVSGRLVISYRELAILVGQASVWLGAQGVKPGEHAGIAMSHSVEHIILSLALMRMGAVMIELPLDSEPKVLDALVRRFEIAVTFHDSGRVVSCARLTRVIPAAWREMLAGFAGDARFMGDAADLKLIVLSSGSTGIQKGIISRQRQRVLRGAGYINNGPYWNTPCPGNLLLAASGETGMVAQFIVNQFLLGGTLVVIPQLSFFSDLIRELQGWDEGICPMTPDYVRKFVAHTNGTDMLFPRMRALVNGGQALAGHAKAEVMARVTPNLYDSYGTSGYGLVSCIGPAEMRSEPESVGQPLVAPGAEIEIMAPDGTRVAPGVTGELRMRGPQTALGFFNPEDNSRGTEKFAGGWYYPGEVAMLNAAGQIIIKGRMADVIRLEGMTIFPAEIEDVLTRSKHVVEAAVVGRAAAGGGEDMVAFVVGAPGFKHQDVAEHVRRRLPEPKRPKYIFYLDALPRTGNGKIDRSALKAAPMKVTGQF